MTQNKHLWDSVSRTEFLDSLTDHAHDKFGKTFVAKCDMSDGWNKWIIKGIWEDSVLQGAFAMSYSKAEPKVANLQLLHTLARGRGKGVGSTLMLEAMAIAKTDGISYFRVSSEIPALPFYSKIGFKFWGRQKSGCGLSMFKFDERYENDMLYDLNDPVIRAAVYKKGKGGCVEVFPEPRSLP